MATLPAVGSYSLSRGSALPRATPGLLPAGRRLEVHAIYFSEDAVKLEAELHGHFASCRVNWVNDRKEFLFATPSDVRDVLAAMVGNLLEFSELVESTEYLRSMHYWPARTRTPGPR
jgi:hypothetical protein